MIRTHNVIQSKDSLKDLVGLSQTAQENAFCRFADSNLKLSSKQKNCTQNSFYYDQFFYTDKLTNKKIKMRDAKTSYERGRPHQGSSSTLQLANMTLNQEKKKRQSRLARKNSNTQLQKQLIDLNECFFMLKSTEMFKMNSLRQKIFKNTEKSQKEINRNTTKHQTQNGKMQRQLSDLILKKKKIRQILEDSVKEANIQQLRRLFKDENYKINPKIIGMNYHMPKSFNKTNIEKIIETMHSSEKKGDDQPRFIKKSEDEVEFPGEEKLKADLLGYMKKQMRENGEYLVVPQKNKLLYHKIYSHANSKSGNLPTFSHQFHKKCRQNLQSANVSPDESPVMSRVLINIPSEQTLEEPNFSSQECNNNNMRSQLVKTNPIHKQTPKRQLSKKQKTCINFHLPYRQNKQNSKPSKITSFLEQFSFSPCSKNGEISKIKRKFETHEKISTKRLNLKQQRFLFMVENGLLFDVEKEILMNEDYLFLKDKKEDNLLHLCAKNHSTEMFLFIIERYKKCQSKRQTVQKWGAQILRDRLLQRNKNNKSVFEVAEVYHAEEIIEILQKLRQEFNIRGYEL